MPISYRDRKALLGWTDSDACKQHYIAIYHTFTFTLHVPSHWRKILLFKF